MINANSMEKAEVLFATGLAGHNGEFQERLRRAFYAHRFLVAGWLQECGVTVPPELLSDEMNPPVGKQSVDLVGVADADGLVHKLWGRLEWREIWYQVAHFRTTVVRNCSPDWDEVNCMKCLTYKNSDHERAGRKLVQDGFAIVSADPKAVPVAVKHKQWDGPEWEIVEGKHSAISGTDGCSSFHPSWEDVDCKECLMIRERYLSEYKGGG